MGWVAVAELGFVRIHSMCAWARLSVGVLVLGWAVSVVAGLDLCLQQRVGAGWGTTCAVNAVGQIQCWGDAKDGNTVPTKTALNWLEVTAGVRHTCAIKNGNNAVCFGYKGASKDGDRRLDVPEPADWERQ